jgi:uncharacterized protein (TIGR02118 family)
LEGPVRLVILFGAPTEPAAFESYYLQAHVPLAEQMTGIVRFESGLAISALGGEPAAFYRMATMEFASLGDLEAALASPEGQAAAVFRMEGGGLFIASEDRFIAGT